MKATDVIADFVISTSLVKATDLIAELLCNALERDFECLFLRELSKRKDCVGSLYITSDDDESGEFSVWSIISQIDCELLYEVVMSVFITKLLLAIH